MISKMGSTVGLGKADPKNETGSRGSTAMLSAFNSFVVQSLPDLAESMIWAMDKIERGC